MSQFIQLPKNIPLQAPVILKGILSKVIQPSFKQNDFSKTIKQWIKQPTQSPTHPNQQSPHLSQLNEQKLKSFYKTNTQKRFIQQMKLADNLQHIIINKQYKKMKQNLTKYGKSHSLKINKLINEKRPQQYFQSLVEVQTKTIKKNKSLHRYTGSHHPVANGHNTSQDIISWLKSQEKHTKFRYSFGSISNSQKQTYHDRVVFVDRKYNNQFSIKMSSLVEAEQIRQGKENYKKFLNSYKQERPLLKEAQSDISRKKYSSVYQKLSIEETGLKKVKNNEQKPKYKRLMRKSYTTLVEKDCWKFAKRKRTIRES